eukprot:TRINITY_DN6300_c0_g1_i1.p1 TRINITY_DN6300_c0_g1~~TRINITY_DN6300_c0_g1_i1.p1  ORF type:complete len:345 (-),score=36.14 TRINITY_DN6300_c0_g1_i1:165-1172(-)
MAQRYRFFVQYNGANFIGYQRNPSYEKNQPGHKSVQSAFEEAVEKLTHKPCLSFAAGRTDSGVHALMNCIHADIERFSARGEKMEDYPCSLFLVSLNHLLRPQGLLVRSVEKIDQRFHARFSCKRRTYHYQFASSVDQDGYPLEAPTRWFIRKNLNLDLMRKAASVFVGRHNFRGYAGSDSELGSIRSLYTFDILEENLSSPFAISIPNTKISPNRRFTARLQARGFLHNQVRKMMASVILAGQGLLSPEQIQMRLASGRPQPKQENMAPPHGLCLVEVAYPEDKFTVTERSAFDWDSFEKDQEYIKQYSLMAKERQKESVAARKTARADNEPEE